MQKSGGKIQNRAPDILQAKLGNFLPDLGSTDIQKHNLQCSKVGECRGGQEMQGKGAEKRKLRVCGSTLMGPDLRSRSEF